MSKHTPGPWKWENHNGKRYDRLMSLDGPVIDYAAYEGMWFSRYDDPEDEANARLIAAAPDLLEALESLRANLLADGDAHGGLLKESRMRCAGIVRDAIAKAKGEA